MNDDWVIEQLMDNWRVRNPVTGKEHFAGSATDAVALYHALIGRV